jgi:methylated-DNA-[protein]-cysteine S-methyltransferase
MLALDWEKSQAEFVQQIMQQFPADVRYDEAKTARPMYQVSEYLSGVRRHFDLTLDLTALSPFHKQVLQLTLQVPYGKTSTYQEIAARMGKPKAARAVGRVEATNPIPLIIPCHRVVGSDGSLHGYGGPGGIKLKAWLLNLEQSRIKKNASFHSHLEI